MTPQNDPIATAQALADHGAHGAYEHMLTRVQARVAGGNKSEAAGRRVGDGRRR